MQRNKKNKIKATWRTEADHVKSSQARERTTRLKEDRIGGKEAVAEKTSES